MFVIDVVGAGAQARLTYSLAHDNMPPLAGFPRKVRPRNQTPIVAPGRGRRHPPGRPNDMTP